MARVRVPNARGQQTQANLREVYLKLLAERPFAEVSVKDIVEAAGIERTTFYLHYPDKMALLDDARRHLLTDLYAHTRHEPVLLERLKIVFGHLEQNKAVFGAILCTDDASLDRQFHTYVARMVEEIYKARLVEAGRSSPLPTELAATFFTSALRGTARWWIDGGCAYPADAMAQWFHDVLSGGVLQLS